MSTTERREVHTTRVVRTLSPQRTISNQNISTFDNNLDNLLEDLQSSVSRPGSSLGNTYRETRTTYGSGKTDSLGRVQHLIAANPTTVVSDDPYNYKPAESVRTVKTYKENYAAYNVNTDISPEKTQMQKNINKLDTLLDDLQQARQGTQDRGISDVGTDPGLLDPTGGSQKIVKKTVHRELVYDLDNAQRGTREGSVGREIQYINDGTYGDIRPIRQQSPIRGGTLQSSKVNSYNYSSESKNATLPSKSKIIESSHPNINPTVLAQLDPNLLPPPNTKVTTTIKTYTYEIPGAGGYPTSVSPKLSETVYSSNPSTPSQSCAYNKIENTSNISNYPGSYVRPVSPNPSGYKHIETTTTRNVTNDNFHQKPEYGFVYNDTTTRNVNNLSPEYTSTPRSPLPSTKQIHVYNETTTNVNQQPPHNTYRYPIDHESTNRYPENHGPNPVQHTYIINETNTTRNVNSHPRNGYPPNNDNGYPPNQPGQTIIYKQDTRTTNNYRDPSPYTETFDPKHVPPPHSGVRPHDPRDPRDPNVNITYKYTTHHTSKNNYRGHPNDETEPLLHPMPFPTDANDGTGPPKKLDQLMAEIGKEPPTNAFNSGYLAKQAEITQKKEKSQLNSEVEKRDVKDLPKTRNVAGPAVYYPPGHELFLHKEESGGYSSAQGGMMKESGKYKYEAKSSSKSKSSSGVAVVPVCLPLCCGLPCVIM